MNGNIEPSIRAARGCAGLSKASQSLRFKLDLLQKLALQSSAGLHPPPRLCTACFQLLKERLFCCFLMLLIIFCRVYLLCSVSRQSSQGLKKSDYGAEKQHPREQICSSGGGSTEEHGYARGRAPAAASAQGLEARSYRDGEISHFSPASHFFPTSGHRHLKAAVKKNQRNCTNTEKNPKSQKTHILCAQIRTQIKRPKPRVTERCWWKICHFQPGVCDPEEGL